MSSWVEIICENVFCLGGHHDHVPHPLAPHYERKTRSDHGTKRCRSSNPGSSSNVLDHPSSSNHIDENDDGNDEESFHSNTPSPSQLINSLSNIVPRVFENPPHKNQTMHTYQTKILNHQSQYRDEHRKGLRSIRRALKNAKKGDDTVGEPVEADGQNTSWIDSPPRYCIPYNEHGISKLIDFIYDEDTLRAPTSEALHHKAIVCPKNETVDIINTKVLAMNEGESTVYVSSDEAILVENDGGETKMLYPMEYLNTIKFSGFPPHRLELKVGTPVMLLRNVNLAGGLCNDKLSTRTNLSNRGMDIPCVLCPVCESEVKTRNHLFFGCSLALDLLSLMGRWWNIHIPSLLDHVAWEAWFNGLRLNSLQRLMLEASFFSVVAYLELQKHGLVLIEEA
ncbi:DNA helicase [Tanacetum coccineum]